MHHVLYFHRSNIPPWHLRKEMARLCTLLYFLCNSWIVSSSMRILFWFVGGFCKAPSADTACEPPSCWHGYSSERMLKCAIFNIFKHRFVEASHFQISWYLQQCLQVGAVFMNEEDQSIYLNGSATGRDERLHGGCVISSCKLLLLGLPALYHRDGHQLFIHPGIQIQNLQHLQKQNHLSVSLYRVDEDRLTGVLSDLLPPQLPPPL